MSVILTPGQAGDNPQLLPLLDQISVGRDGPGRPRKRPERVLADKAYSHPSTRAALRRRGIAFTSPERIDQINHRHRKGSRGGRPPAFDQEIYADRNVVERCFNRLKQFRALATRYAKRVAYYRSEIVIATIVLWLRTDLQDTPYSPRVRPGAPVSFPVAWDDLAGVHPTDFTIRTAPELLGDADPWADALPAPQALPADLVEQGHTIPVARVAAMHEGKRRARARRQ